MQKVLILDAKNGLHSGEDITAKSTKHTIGGCAFNVADVLNKLHLPFDLMIPIGNGDYSKIIYKSFKEKNYKNDADMMQSADILASGGEDYEKNIFCSSICGSTVRFYILRKPGDGDGSGDGDSYRQHQGDTERSDDGRDDGRD